MSDQPTGPPGGSPYPRYGPDPGASGTPVAPAPFERFAGRAPAPLVALAVLAAGALGLVSMLVAMAAFPGELGGAPGFVDRLQWAVQPLGIPLVLVVPVALLLARGGAVVGDPGSAPGPTAAPPPGATGPGATGPVTADPAADPVVHLVVVGASWLGGTFSVLAVLRLVADQFGGRVVVQSQGSAFFADLGTLVLAVAATWWAVRELRALHGRSPAVAPGWAATGEPVVPGPHPPASPSVGAAPFGAPPFGTPPPGAVAPPPFTPSPPPTGPPTAGPAGPPGSVPRERAEWRPADAGWSDRPPVWPAPPPSDHDPGPADRPPPPPPPDPGWVPPSDR